MIVIGSAATAFAVDDAGIGWDAKYAAKTSAIARMAAVRK
jgi:hypothetical protein